MNDQLNASEEDEDVTRPQDRSALTELQGFNPRIRIIGVPAATVPAALQQEVPDHLNWEDEETVVATAATRELPHKEASAVSVRAIMDVGEAPPMISDPWTDEPQPTEPESGPLMVSERESDSGVRPACASSSQGGVVTSAPELSLSSLDWDDHENHTDVMPEMGLAWGDDEVTMPQREADRRTQAARKAAVSSRLSPAPLSAALGPTGTLVDASTMVEGLTASEPERVDTIIDEEPPSEVARASESEPNSGPQTLPSVPPAVLSMEIDLAELNSVHPEPDPELEDADDRHTPLPSAIRTPSVSAESFPPVAVVEPAPFTRPSTTPRRRRGGLYALAAVLTVCVGVLAFVLYPKTGSLSVRLTSDDGTIGKAEIFVDGQKRCDTDPCIIGAVAPGEHVVKVVAPGREPVEASVTIVADEASDLTVPLPAAEVAAVVAPSVDVAPEPRGVLIELVTEGARVVLVEGRETRVLKGAWPQTLELAPGHYKIVASRHGYAPFVQQLEVTEGGQQQLVRVELAASAPTAPAEATPPAAKPTASEPDSDGDIYED